MKAISAAILLFFILVFGLALYDAQDLMAPSDEEPGLNEQTLSVPAKVRPLSVSQKKKLFIKNTLPAILHVKAKLDKQYAHVLQLSKKEHLSDAELALIENLKKRYKVNGIPCLLNCLQTHPASIVLAQAALETGWGTSRFYSEANNIFGIWSYNRNEPRIPASETRGEKTVYIKKYASLEHSIEGYFKMMATGHAYNDFREARRTEKNPFKLIGKLTHYSELREEYVKRLYHVIKSNRFYQYDTPSYKPIALSKIIPEYVKREKEKKALEARLAAESEAIPLNEVTAFEERNDADGTDCNVSLQSAAALRTKAGKN